VAQILGYSSPAVPVRRQVSIFDCKEVDLTPYGMIVDTSGVYFHPEATNGLAGFATQNEPSGINYQYDGENFFNEFIWPALYERSTCFEKLKHLTGWAGLYEVSPDECAILGPVLQGEGKKSGNIYEAHSFSGHGVMQSYSAGLVLAEQIIKGRYETLDASVLSSHRFDRGELIPEKLVI
jgi:glycine/D-amino acid oxidase-like deaminating enzyme